jgi:hypothetical protein
MSGVLTVAHRLAAALGVVIGTTAVFNDTVLQVGLEIITTRTRR